jgi:dipeptidyl aminopeptidase/acylaminoacyl peptidase
MKLLLGSLALGCALYVLIDTRVAAQTPAALKPVTHEALWMMKRVSTPSVSPDGKWVVFSILEPSYEKDKSVSDLWVVAADGSQEPRRLTNTREPEEDVDWAPDSGSIAFSTKREGDESAQIYILDLARGGEARRLSNLSSGAERPKWSPDGKAILFESWVYPGALDDETNKKIAAEHKSRKYNVRTYEHFPVRYWNQWLDDRRLTIMVQPIDGSPAKDILSGSALAQTVGFGGKETDDSFTLAPLWSPDGREVIFDATVERWNAAFASVGHLLYRMPAQGGEPRPIGAMKGDYNNATFTPDGKTLLYTYSLQDAEVYHVPHLYGTAWPAGGEGVPLAPQFDHEPEQIAVTSDSKTVYLLVPDAGKQALYRVATKGGTPEPIIVPPMGGYTALVIAQKRAQPVLIASYGSSVKPKELVRIDPVKRSHTELTHIDTAAAAGLDWQPPEHFSFTSSKGRNIHNMLVRPPAFDASKRYPLLVVIHGGPASNNPDQIGLRWNYHLLAAPGYVVLLTDYTGSTSFGEKFAQAIKLDPLRTPGEEIDQAVDEALKRYSFIDRTRMCAAGASYGGHLVNWLESTSSRYRCLISHAGEVDLFTQWGESDVIYHRELTDGGAPWAGSPIWRDQSAITYAANWKTPILLSVGERDFRVPIGNTLEFYAALQRQRVPARLLVWPDAWHWISNPEDSRHFYEEEYRWLAKYLQ